MEAPCRPVDTELLNEADHIGREGVGIFLLVVGNEVHDPERRRADLTEENRMLGRHRRNAIPPLVPVVGVPGVHDAVAGLVFEAVTGLFAAFNRLALDAGEIVRPEKPAGDNHVVRADRTHGIDERLHADGFEALVFLLLVGIEKRRLVVLALLADPAAVAPDFPADAVRLVEKIEDDRGMILVVRGAILPEFGMLRFRSAETVKVDRDVRPAVGGQTDDLVDSGAKRLAAVVLIGAAPEPVRLVDRQADAVGVPLVNADYNRLNHLIAVGDALHSAGVKALQPHLLAVGIDEAVALYAHRLWPLGAVLRLIGNVAGCLLALARGGGGMKLGRIGGDKSDILHLQFSGLDHKEAGHHHKLCRVFRNEERLLARLPALGVLLSVNGTGLALEFLARGVFEFEKNARIKPRLFAAREIFDFPLPGHLHGFNSGGQIVFAIGVYQLARLGRNEFGVAFAFFLRRNERTVALQTALCALTEFGGIFSLALLPVFALGLLGRIFHKFVLRDDRKIADRHRSALHVEKRRHNRKAERALGNLNRFLDRKPIFRAFPAADMRSTFVLLKLGIDEVHHNARIEPRLRTTHDILDFHFA